MGLLDKPTTVIQILLLALVAGSGAQVPGSLKLVHYLFRHGDRSPTHAYPGDPNPPSTWPRGLGQLSRTGMDQEYQLGRYMRHRYDGFLHDVYTPDQIKVVSTDRDRTIQSALSHLAGLFPPKPQDKWNENIDWQPIAVHSLPKQMDMVLNIKICPKLNKLRKEVWDLPYYQQVTEREQPFIDWISGKVNKQYTIQDMYTLKDPIYIEHLHNLPLPSFVNESTVERLVFFDLIVYKSQTHTREMQRLSGGAGPLIDDILKRAKQKINKTLDPEDLKLYLYSAHDSTIVAFLNTIKTFDDVLPTFAAAVIVELHEVDGKFHFEILYRNDTTVDPYQITMPGCEFKCPVEKFESLLGPYISDDLASECSLENDELVEPATMKILMIVLACAAAILFLLVIALIVALAKAKGDPVPNYEVMGGNL